MDENCLPWTAAPVCHNSGVETGRSGSAVGCRRHWIQDLSHRPWSATRAVSLRFLLFLPSPNFFPSLSILASLVTIVTGPFNPHPIHVKQLEDDSRTKKCSI